jgi:hypothetical protein
VPKSDGVPTSHPFTSAVPREGLRSALWDARSVRIAIVAYSTEGQLWPPPSSVGRKEGARGTVDRSLSRAARMAARGTLIKHSGHLFDITVSA